MLSHNLSEPLVQQDVYYSRLHGVVSDRLREKRVFAVGCGASSYAIIKLAKCGVSFSLADPDRVSVENLCRTSYNVGEVGEYKTDALKRQIESANPLVEITSEPVDILLWSMDDWARRLISVDLIIAGTDSFAAQARLNQVSRRFGLPAIFVGFHNGAEGGRIIYSIPGRTACYRCVAADRYEKFEQDGGESTDLDGVPGGIIDAQFIDMVAAKIALGLLERGVPSAMGRFGDALGMRNEVIVRTSPFYEYGNELWDAVLSDLPSEPRPFATELKTEALFAMDTLWLRAECDPSCPDCGIADAEGPSR